MLRWSGKSPESTGQEKESGMSGGVALRGLGTKYTLQRQKRKKKTKGFVALTTSWVKKQFDTLLTVPFEREKKEETSRLEGSRGQRKRGIRSRGGGEWVKNRTLLKKVPNHLWGQT